MDLLPRHLTDALEALAVGLRRPVPGGLQGLHRSRHHGASVEFADYRAYAPGDPPERIDWAVYARSDRHLVRRTEDETRLAAHLLIDTSASMGFAGGGRPSKLRQAVQFAAAAAFVLVRQGDRVRVHPFAAGLLPGPPAAGSLASLEPLVAGLAALRPAGAGDAAAVLHAAAEALRPRGLVVVLSDLLRPAGEVIAGCAHLVHAGHQVALVQILDRDELHLPWSGVVEVRDLETGGRAVIEADAVRRDYAHALDAHLDAMRRGAAGLGAAHHLVETGADIPAALRACLESA